ncbi:hypothetical protein A9Q81_05110 [Gammaproteobacteria bacterium 42_54_T18]|nr:hypothetical protein A9Q81_05110 [Gammaproteobacteria bacterium 42_54_T18]
MANNTFNNFITDVLIESLEKLLLTTIVKDTSELKAELEFCHCKILKEIRLKKSNIICMASIRRIEKSFDTNPEIKQRQLTILDCVLQFINSELNIKSPSSSTIISLTKELPIISKYECQKSRLSERLYELIEQEFITPSQGLEEVNSIGRLGLNLILNEGVTNPYILTKLLNSQKHWYRCDDGFYFQVDDKRQIVGLETVLLLSLHWIHFKVHKPFSESKILDSINNFLKIKSVIDKQQRVSYTALNASFRLEHAFSVNPNALFMVGNTKYSQQVSHETFVRLLTHKNVEVEPIVTDKTIAVKKWTSAWKNKNTAQQLKSDWDPIEKGLKTVKFFLAKLKGQKISLLPDKQAVVSSINEWLKHKDNLNNNPASWLIVAWLSKLIKKGNIKEGELGIKSIKDYVSTVAKYFIPIFAEFNLSELSLDNWGDKFNEMVECFPSVQRQKYATYFISFLVDSQFIALEVLERIEIAGSPMSLTANLISIDHAEVILDHLSKNDSTINNVARLVFCFAMFGGNRRGEVKHLELRDITLGDNYANERIYSRKGETLKSVNANRNIPLNILWPEAELRLLANFKESRLCETNNKKSALFKPDELRKAFDLITELLIEITGDPNISFHVLRHSFCNWLLILISSLSGNNDSRGLIFLDSSYFSNVRISQLKHRLGISSQASRKQLFAVSELLGHGNVYTTLKHYFHLRELYWYIHKNNYCHNIPTFAKKLFGYSTKLTTSYPLVIKNNLILDHTLNSFNRFTGRFSAISHDCMKKIVIKYSTKRVNSSELSVLQAFNIFKLANHEYSNVRISNDLGLDREIVNGLFEVALDISKTLPKRSKYKLPNNPLKELKLYKYKYVKSLCERFDGLSVGSLSDVNLTKALEPISTILMSKNYLIRNNSHKPIIALMNLLRLLGFNINSRIYLKVYMTPKVDEDIEKLNIYLRRFEYIIGEFSKVFGIDYVVNIKLIIPKKFKNRFSKNQLKNINLDFSDDAKFIGSDTKAMYALFIHKKLNKAGQFLNTPTRDRLVVAFLHILKVWHDHKITSIDNNNIN